MVIQERWKLIKMDYARSVGSTIMRCMAAQAGATTMTTRKWAMAAQAGTTTRKLAGTTRKLAAQAVKLKKFLTVKRFLTLRWLPQARTDPDSADEMQWRFRLDPQRRDQRHEGYLLSSVHHHLPGQRLDDECYLRYSMWRRQRAHYLPGGRERQMARVQTLMRRQRPNLPGQP